jgi:hypothetical protein
MGGLLTHLSIAIIGAIVLILIFYKSKYKWIYASSFFLGSLIPDLVDFGIAGLMIGSIDPTVIMYDKWFNPLAHFSHNFWNWFIIAGLIISVVTILHWASKKIMSRKLIAVAIIASILFLIAIVIHLNIDFYIQEVHWWI